MRGARRPLSSPQRTPARKDSTTADQVSSTGFWYKVTAGDAQTPEHQVSVRAQPLVQRDRDQAFHSLFITHAGSPIRSLADLKDKQFAFGDVNSTSGHLMPEYFMRQQGVDPDVIARALYTGGHDATALAVALVLLGEMHRRRPARF